MSPTTPKPPPTNARARELIRVALAMSTAAGTVYTSVRSALSNHEARINLLETQQTAADEKRVPREELDAHWSAISAQLARIEQDLRDLRNEENLRNAQALDHPQPVSPR